MVLCSRLLLRRHFVLYSSDVRARMSRGLSLCYRLTSPQPPLFLDALQCPGPCVKACVCVYEHRGPPTANAVFHQTPNVLSCPLISPSNADQTDHSACTGQRSPPTVLYMLSLLTEMCVCVCVV